jgi:hypothetical protein
MTDEEWYVHLWCGLSADVMHARKAAVKSDHEDARELMDFEEWVDGIVEELCEQWPDVEV